MDRTGGLIVEVALERRRVGPFAAGNAREGGSELMFDSGIDVGRDVGSEDRLVELEISELEVDGARSRCIFQLFFARGSVEAAV